MNPYFNKTQQMNKVNFYEQSLQYQSHKKIGMNGNQKTFLKKCEFSITPTQDQTYYSNYNGKSGGQFDQHAVDKTKQIIMFKEMHKQLQKLRIQLKEKDYKKQKRELQNIKQKQKLQIQISTLKNDLKQLQIKKQKQKQQQIQQESKKLSEIVLNKQKNMKISNPQQKIDDSDMGNKYRLLGINFQNRVSNLIQQNYKLKNILSMRQSRIAQLQKVNGFQQQTIIAYEQRDSMLEQNLQKSQLKQWRDKYEQLRQKWSQQQSWYQLQILNLQNKLSEKQDCINKQNNKEQNLKLLFMEQLNQIQMLNLKIRQLTSK